MGSSPRVQGGALRALFSGFFLGRCARPGGCYLLMVNEQNIWWVNVGEFSFLSGVDIKALCHVFLWGV